MSIKSRIERILKKLEPEDEIKIYVTKEGDPPLPPEIEKTITRRFVVSGGNYEK